MGQYYKLVVLNTKKKSAKNSDKIKAYMKSWDFEQGAKLMEFSWIGNHFVEYLESLINKENGVFAYYPIIVAGDYADEEPNTYNKEKWNIYQLCDVFGERLTPEWFAKNCIKHKHYRYIINEDKMVFIDTERMRKCNVGYGDEKWQVHPLTILLSDGNGRGGGDYGKKHREVGSWKRNVVLTSDNRPNEDEYREVFYDFYEEW